MIDAADIRGHARRAIVASLIALVAVPRAWAVIPGRADLPQGLAVTGPDGRSWALSLADPYVVSDAAYGYAFGEALHDAASRAYYVAVLLDSWRVKSRGDLLQRLESLRTQGTRAIYADLLAQVSVGGRRGWWQRSVDMLQDRVRAYRVAIVERESAQLGAAGILAFDISRRVNTARWGYAAGYLSESEAWRLILPAARLAQSSFDSWEAFGRSFLVGRDFFWASSNHDTSQREFVRAVHDLQTRPDGAWRIHPWRQPLGDVPIRAADPEAGDQ